MGGSVALLLFLAAAGFWMTAQAIYYWMIHRVNASGQLEKEIGWVLQHPIKALKVFTSHKRIFPQSRLPKIYWICSLLGVALMFCGAWVSLLKFVDWS